MSKKVFVLAILMLCVVGIFAQTADAKKNTILGGLVLLTYERSLSPAWSVGGEIDLSLNILPTLQPPPAKQVKYAVLGTNFMFFGRWYPTQKGIFFTQLGLGLTSSASGNSPFLAHIGCLIRPEIGARFIFSNGFALQIKGGLGISLGAGEESEKGKYKYTGFSYAIGTSLGLGFGYNF